MTELECGGEKENRKKEARCAAPTSKCAAAAHRCGWSGRCGRPCTKSPAGRDARSTISASLIQAHKNSNTPLTAGIRVFLMLYLRAAATDEGHGRAGHGNFREMTRRARAVGAAV